MLRDPKTMQKTSRIRYRRRQELWQRRLVAMRGFGVLLLFAMALSFGVWNVALAEESIEDGIGEEDVGVQPQHHERDPSESESSHWGTQQQQQQQQRTMTTTTKATNSVQTIRADDDGTDSTDDNDSGSDTEQWNRNRNKGQNHPVASHTPDHDAAAAASLDANTSENAETMRAWGSSEADKAAIKDDTDTNTATATAPSPATVPGNEQAPPLLARAVVEAVSRNNSLDAIDDDEQNQKQQSIKVGKEDPEQSSAAEDPEPNKSASSSDGTTTLSKEHPPDHVASKQRVWGSGSHESPSTTSGAEQGSNRSSNNASSVVTEKDHPPATEKIHIPFVKGSNNNEKNRHPPPEGFTLAARVYIDDDDKLAHFDYDDDQQCPITLPYFDCGAAGVTTSPIPVSKGYFRHSLGAPTVWRDPDMHPVLAVGLTNFEISLDSGESLEFKAGQVVLLEDSVRPGHRIKARGTGNGAAGGAAGAMGGENPLSIFFVTLPQPQYQTGRKNLSLKKANREKACVTKSSVDGQLQSNTSTLNSFSPSRLQWDGRRFRTMLFGTIAFSISTLAADFLGKTAPLWLAVGIGGTCFVVGSTVALTKASEYIFSGLQLWREQRIYDQKSRRQSKDSF